MTRDTVLTAVREGLPFRISTADGKEYVVKESYEIAVATTNAYVVGDDGLAHVLPFLTMTGLSNLKSNDAAES